MGRALASAGARWPAWLLAFALVLATRAARADPTLPEASLTLEYRRPQEKHYWRAVLEELGLQGLGLGYYFLELKNNSIDWALNYDWLSFRQKLTCEACTFDQNYFDTNFVTHPAAGLLYYIAARGNRLSLLESFGYGFAMSTLWEFLGEFRERVSVNDFFVTPIAGLALGESTTQLGAFFDRSCPSDATRVLGSLLAPSKSLHDALDGAEPARDTLCDARGLSAGGAHRFRLWLGGAGVFSADLPGTASEARFGVDTEVAHLDSLGRPGRGWLAFSDGNVASLGLRMALEPRFVSDLRIGASVLPAGLHYRNLRDAGSGRASGQEVLIGLLVGTEYAEHRRARPSGELDRIFLIEAPAARLEFIVRRRAATLFVSLDGGATLAGVNTYALPDYLQHHPDTNLASVTRAQGYSHALGLALAPSLRLVLDGAELGAEARGDRFFAVRVLDPLRPAHGMTPIFESRRRAETWLAIGPNTGAPRAVFFVDAYQRTGVAADARRTSSEVTVGTRLEAVF
jgi:hypothetical protein